MNNNNLTYISGDIFKPLIKLKTLRIYENPLICDCNLLWVFSFNHRFSRLTLQTKCIFPSHKNSKKYTSLSSLKAADLKCTGNVLTFVVDLLEKLKII